METNHFLVVVSIPFLSGFLGWLTNYIAIKTLFRPYKPISFLGFTIQGLLPKRQKELSTRIAKVIIKYLISNSDIILAFDNKEQLERIKNKAKPYLKEQILQEVPSLMKSMAEPLIENVLEKKTIPMIKELSHQLNDHLFENIDLEEIIFKRLSEYNTENLEKVVLSIAKKELRYIEYLGFIIGFIIGLVQIGLILFLF